MNFKKLGHTTKNTIFRLVKLLADLRTRPYAVFRNFDYKMYSQQ